MLATLARMKAGKNIQTTINIELQDIAHHSLLKQLEDFEMPQLTILLNSVFTNVEQLSFKCTICNNFNAKNKRALITHQNKCKKQVVHLNQDS